MEENYTYFQYHRDEKYPIYIRLNPASFGTGVVSLLKKLHFVELESKEIEQVKDQMKSNGNARLLNIDIASNRVARHMDYAVESDSYGLESVMPKEGYRLYRYKGVGVMVYSFATQSWELGVHYNFGEDEVLSQSKAVINRFLGWSLFSFGVIGIWGVPVDEGVVVLGQRESQGEAVYIDLKRNRLLSEDGGSRFPQRFKILRLDGSLKNRSVTMTSGQLSSFLATQTTFMDSSGLNIPIRQMLKTLSYIADGMIHPKDLFRPRTELNP